MTVHFSLHDDQTSAIATVTKNGALIVAPIKYSTAYYISVNSLVALEIVPAEVKYNFIITGVLIASDKSFGTSTTAETITLYEASPSDLATNLKTIFKLDMLRNDRLVATDMNLLTSKSVSIVAIATDVNVDVTLAGYFVDV